MCRIVVDEDVRDALQRAELGVSLCSAAIADIADQNERLDMLD